MDQQVRGAGHDRVGGGRGAAQLGVDQIDFFVIKIHAYIVRPGWPTNCSKGLLDRLSF